jgi:hypothetical protein
MSGVFERGLEPIAHERRIVGDYDGFYRRAGRGHLRRVFASATFRRT